ncbi:MAG: amidohydrolase family protein [Chitinophagaceae bacterium]|nr:amidohydrolase family protein [Chitinophagaceae bacterium]
MRIDSHVHFWKYNKQRDSWITNQMKVLQEDYLPEQISLTLKRNDIDGVVAVQVDQQEVESRFLVELAATHPIIKGVVGWVDLQADNINDRLEELSVHKIIKGYRHIVQAERDDFLLDANFQRGVAALKEFDYTYDILIYPRQLPAAEQFINRFPDQKLVIDHCAKPEVKTTQITEWAEAMQRIAQSPNVYCKLSGLFTEAKWKDWSAADFYPYFDVVFNAFGPERLLFGSDWPVMLLSGIYVQWKSLVEKYMEGFIQDDKDNVFGLNAIRFYNL